MKNLKSVIYILMIFFFASCASSKVTNYKNEIIGTWLIKNVSGNSNSEILNQAKIEAKNTVYNFYENNLVEIKVGKIINKGNWEFEKSGDELLIKRENEKIIYKVEEISNGKMILNFNLGKENLKFTLNKLKR